MTRVVIGIGNESLVSDLSSLLQEMDGYDVRAVARSTSELLDLASRLEPDLVFVHDELGVEPVVQTIRDLSSRRPAMAILQVSPLRTSDMVIRAMEAGARGVVAHPFAYDDLSSRVMAASEWSIHMQGILEGASSVASGRGRVLAIVGAKGGVGTTTMATHLAYDHVEKHPHDRVCLIDVDVEKGDVAAILEVRQSVSIADVAKVAADLSPTAVNDAVILHESGVNLLLAPLDVREAELVSAEALRSIVAMLRREFNVIIVDGGGHVSPAQAAVVEIADEALIVTTADVLSIRGMRRRLIAWEALGVREEGAFKVLINKVDKQSLFPSSSVPKLTTAHVLKTEVPWSPRVLEASINDRDPRAVGEVGWWRLMARIREEVGLEAAVQPGPRPLSAPAAPSRRRGRRGRTEQATPAAPAAPPAVPAAEPAGTGGRRRGRDRGGIALENAGIFPIALLLALIAWQVGVIGYAFVYSGHASRAAAREYAITGSAVQAKAAADDVLPGVLKSGLQVQASSGDIRVTVRVPAAGPSGLGLPQTLTTSRSVVSER